MAKQAYNEKDYQARLLYVRSQLRWTIRWTYLYLANISDEELTRLSKDTGFTFKRNKHTQSITVSK